MNCLKPVTLQFVTLGCAGFLLKELAEALRLNPEYVDALGAWLGGGISTFLAA